MSCCRCNETPYLYVLVRKDLSPAQRIVQTAHAAIEHARHIPSTKEHPHLVVLGVANDTDLWLARESIKKHNLSHIMFREPDLNNQATAICVGPVYNGDRRHFRHYQLLTGE